MRKCFFLVLFAGHFPLHLTFFELLTYLFLYIPNDLPLCPSLFLKCIYNVQSTVVLKYKLFEIVAAVMYFLIFKKLRLVASLLRGGPWLGFGSILKV